MSDPNFIDKKQPWRVEVMCPAPQSLCEAQGKKNHLWCYYLEILQRYSHHFCFRLEFSAFPLFFFLINNSRIKNLVSLLLINWPPC